jgi:hypothetical protein
VPQPECDTLRTANADLQSQIQELELANRELNEEISVLKNEKTRGSSLYRTFFRWASAV